MTHQRKLFFDGKKWIEEQKSKLVGRTDSNKEKRTQVYNITERKRRRRGIKILQPKDPTPSRRLNTVPNRESINRRKWANDLVIEVGSRSHTISIHRSLWWLDKVVDISRDERSGQTTEIVRDERWSTETESEGQSERMDQGGIKKTKTYGWKIERKMVIDEGAKRECRSSDVEHPHA